MAGTCGCDSTWSCDCCGNPENGAERPEVEEWREKGARPEAEPRGAQARERVA